MTAITSKQLRELHALLRDHGVTGDVAVHAYLNAWLDEHDDDQHPLDSRADLAGPTATRIIRELRGADITTAAGGLARALVAFQAEMPTVAKSKSATIPGKNGAAGFSYSYADLADVVQAATPLLTKHGLAFIATAREGAKGYELVGVLMHTSGEREEGSLPIHGNEPRALGSAITYARRYLLGMMTGIVTDDDTDGSGTGGHQQARAYTGPSTLDLIDQIETDAKRAGVTYEQATEKFRAGRPIESLDTLDPWHLTDLAARVKARADEVVAARAAEEATAAAPVSDTPDPADGSDPWATPAT